MSNNNYNALCIAYSQALQISLEHILALKKYGEDHNTTKEIQRDLEQAMGKITNIEKAMFEEQK